MIRTVYCPDTWNMQRFYEDPRRPALLEWLTANGIAPDDLPIEQNITIERDMGHPPLIRYVAHVRNDDGGVRASDNGQPIIEARTARLEVEPPAELMPEG